MQKIFNNDKDWFVAILVTAIVAAIVLVSNAIDRYYNREDFNRCVSAQIHLGAEATIAHKLCRQIMER